jgi:hypothetical protein
MNEKLTKCLGIAAVHTSAAPAPLEEGGHQLIVQLVNGTSTTNQPLIELAQQLQPCLNRRRGVEARREVRGERVKIRADDATFLTPVTLRNRLLLPVFSLLGPRAVEKTTAGLCRIGKRQFGDGLHEKNRSVDESGIIRDPACWRLCRCRHDRHSCATLLLAQGVNPRVVMETLGHSQVSLTLNTYTHVLPALQRDAAAKINAVLKG